MWRPLYILRSHCIRCHIRISKESGASECRPRRQPDNHQVLIESERMPVAVRTNKQEFDTTELSMCPRGTERYGVLGAPLVMKKIRDSHMLARRSPFEKKKVPQTTHPHADIKSKISSEQAIILRMKDLVSHSCQSLQQ